MRLVTSSLVSKTIWKGNQLSRRPVKHFRYFPKIFYPGTIEKNGTLSDLHECANIILGARFREVLKDNAFVFYPYTIHDDDRPDIIAHKYYGSSDYTWIIFYANDILDPLYDWPLPYTDFKIGRAHV